MTIKLGSRSIKALVPLCTTLLLWSAQTSAQIPNPSAQPMGINLIETHSMNAQTGGTQSWVLMRDANDRQHISDATEIQDIRALDTRRVLLELSTERAYLLTLARDCLTLPFARHVSVTVSNNAIFPGFDAVTADGVHCQIKEIKSLDHAQRLALSNA